MKKITKTINNICLVIEALMGILLIIIFATGEDFPNLFFILIYILISIDSIKEYFELKKDI